MLKRKGPFNKKELVEAAKDYADLHKGKVPYQDLDTKKIGYVIFEDVGVVWVFKEIIRG